MPKPLATASAALAGVLLFVDAAAAPDAMRQIELDYLLRQDCGSCHGMTLRGGLGPPLLPQNLAIHSDATLLAVILHGRPGTPMPPWQALLSEEDARWLVERLRRGETP